MNIDFMLALDLSKWWFWPKKFMYKWRMVDINLTNANHKKIMANYQLKQIWHHGPKNHYNQF
jgi:hypothetical protein